MPDEKRFDPFKPPQPRIPGVTPRTEQAPPHGPVTHAEPAVLENDRKSRTTWVTIVVLAFLVLIFKWGWSAFATSQSGSPVVAVAPEAPVALPAEPAVPAVHLPESPPGPIAAVSDFDRPWSAKRFLFRGGDGDVPAMAVRLPGGEYWGFSLREPFGSCQLDFVTDLRELASKYHFSASHPMVVDPCNGTVYDLMQYGNAPSGLVRGAIQKGAGVRPPLAIEIAARGNEVVAVRME